MKISFYYKFKETSLAVDASMAYDQMIELEKTVDCESFMKECLACGSVYRSKISTLEIPGLPAGGLCGGANGSDPCESNGWQTRTSR